jgi:hypothetical protein
MALQKIWKKAVMNYFKAGIILTKLATSNRRYVIDVTYRNSMHYSVNSSHQNDSDIAFKIITQ